MTCPECGEELRSREGLFPDCQYCGLELLDEAAISLREETRREFERAKREYYPERVPLYEEYMRQKHKP